MKALQFFFTPSTLPHRAPPPLWLLPSLQPRMAHLATTTLLHLSHHPWRCSKNAQMWHFGYGLVGMVVLGGWLDLMISEVFSSLWFYDYPGH